MKRLHALLLRATVAALLLSTLGASVASADPGQRSATHGVTPTTTSIPEDPGFK